MSAKEERAISYGFLTLSFAIAIVVLSIVVVQPGFPTDEQSFAQKEIPAAIWLFGAGFFGLITRLVARSIDIETGYDAIVGIIFTLIGLLSFYDILTSGPKSFVGPVFGFTQVYAPVYFFVGLVAGYRGLRGYFAREVTNT